MSKLKVLAIVLGGYLTIALSLQKTLSAQPPEKQIIGQKTEQITPLTSDEKEKDRFADYPEHTRTRYYSILRNIKEANKDYVGRARKIASSIEESIKKHGIKTIVAIRNKAHSSCLDLALERINHKMLEKEFDKKTKQIAKQYYGSIQKTNVSAPINFTKDIMIQASRKKVILDVLFYERLLTSNLKATPKKTNPTSDYKELVKSAFAEKEYSEVISKRLSAVDGIYDAFLKSRVGFRGWFAASEINGMRMFAKQYYKEQAEQIYPTKASKKFLKRKKQDPNPEGRDINRKG